MVLKMQIQNVIFVSANINAKKHKTLPGLRKQRPSNQKVCTKVPMKERNIATHLGYEEFNNICSYDTVPFEFNVCNLIVL